MLKNIFYLSLGLILTSGCAAPLLVGVAAGAGAAGYAVIGDSAKGNIDCEYRDLWDTTLKVLKDRKSGIYVTNESKGIVKAKVSGNSVAVKINTVSPGVQYLKVSAQKFLMPKPQFAQEIFQTIVNEL